MGAGQTLQIEYRSTASLVPYARNARTHNARQVDQIVASIKTFGFTNPVLIDAQNGIIAGHGRVLAALQLQLAEVPCIVLAGLSPAQRRAYVLADNKLALNSGWNWDMLAVELKDLAELDDVSLGLTGFTDKELKSLMGDEAGGPPRAVFDVKKFLLMIEYADEQALQRGFDEAMAKGLACKILE